MLRGKRNIMKQILVLFAAAALFASSALAAENDLDKIQGKWEVQKTNGRGEKVKQVLEIKKDKLTFRVIGADDQLRLFAAGQVKLEKLGPFSILKVIDIKAGQSESDTDAIDDDRTIVYQLKEDTLTLASNLDKERDDQPPALDVYRKASK